MNLTEKDVLDYTNINGYNLLDKIVKEEIELKNKYLSSGLSFSDFYESEMKNFFNLIVQQMIIDYRGKINQDIYLKLYKFIEDNSVMFINSQDFPTINKDGIKGLAFARASEGKVYFPKMEDIDDINEAIIFIRKNKQSMVHEIFHLITQSYLPKRKLQIDGNDYGEYRPGYLFDEAVVEKSAKEFATRHNFLYHPMISYMEYVLELEKIMKRYSISDESQLFNLPFNKMLREYDLINYLKIEFNRLIKDRKINISCEDLALESFNKMLKN